MTTKKSLLWAALLSVAWACGAQAADDLAKLVTFKQAAAAWKGEGLQPVKAEGLHLVVVRKAAQLDGYSKVLLKPPVVEINPDWRRKSGMQSSTTAVKVQPVIEQITAMLHEETRKALTDGGYALAEAPGAGVVEVELAIVNLFLIATEASVKRGDSMDGRSVGRMTLVATLRDSQSGEVILHAFDDEVGPMPERLMRDAVAECMNWARSAMAGWAGALRGGLDISSGRKPLASR
jgi:Protein of unknown function (DUF3313)